MRTDILDQLVRFELTGRDVHRDIEPVAQGVPTRTLAAGLFEHPPADIDDHARVLEDGDEVVGLHDAADRDGASASSASTPVVSPLGRLKIGW